MDPDTPTPDTPGDRGAAKTRSRDRAATERAILDAAQTILTQQGASGFGVNAVARAARVDKQLIYRYYGGLDGLLEALGDRIALWWQDKLLDGAPDTPPHSYGALMTALALRLLHLMRTEPLAMQSALWELTDSTGLVRTLTASRGRALGLWMAQARGTLQPPDGVDAAAVNAVIVAAISYMVLASRTSNTVIGLAADDAATWGRIETAICGIIRSTYGP